MRMPAPDQKIIADKHHLAAALTQLLGTDGLIGLIREQGGIDLDRLITRVKELHKDALTDDLAALVLSKR